jgi:hypothetical protein
MEIFAAAGFLARTIICQRAGARLFNWLILLIPSPHLEKMKMENYI